MEQDKNHKKDQAAREYIAMGLGYRTVLWVQLEMRTLLRRINTKKRQRSDEL